MAPGNKDRGYVLRRLVRRGLVAARRLGLPAGWHARAVAVVAGMLGEAYPEVARGTEARAAAIAEAIADEAGRFEHALAHGLRVLARCAAVDRRETGGGDPDGSAGGAEGGAPRGIDGKAAFDLLQTHGLPLEVTRELAEAAGKQVDEDGFRRALEAHRARSRPEGNGTFHGGLADDSAEVVGYHTVTHLLLAALRAELGAHVVQRGSNITHERLRFDFSHGERLRPEELAQVEARVERWLARDLVVERATMTEAEARAIGAIGAFGENYGAIVSVYAITDRATGEVVSREFCGGPHVASTAALRGRRFRIVREQAIASGVRRIKAVLA